MHNYGLDEDQEKAIRWAISNIDSQIATIKDNLKYDKWRIEVAKREETRERLIKGATIRNERLIMLVKHRETLANMLPVTAFDKPMYSDNEGRTP